MKLIWLNASDNEFARISQDIAQDHPKAAISFELTVMALVDNLKIFPEAGRIGRVDGTREGVLAHFPYVLIYRTRGDEVQVLGLRHTARQWPEPQDD